MGLADQLRKVSERPPLRLRPRVLLCSNTVKPMHGVAPRVVLGKDWWDREREAAYQSTDYHCVACGVHKRDAREHQWLEGHEVYKTDYRRGRMVYVETVPLCHYCHCYIHNGRLKALVKKGEVTAEKYNAVIDHGNCVLANARVTPPEPHGGPMAPWHKWRLVIDGAEYPPLYKDFDEWKEKFGHAEGDW